MGKRTEKFKKHVQDHEAVYISIGAAVMLAGGVAVGAILGSKQIVITDTANLKICSPTTTTVTVVLEELSTPSKALYCPELKQAFNSIGDAARKLKLPRSTISSAVGTGKIVGDGFTFVEATAEKLA